MRVVIRLTLQGSCVRTRRGTTFFLETTEVSKEQFGRVSTKAGGLRYGRALTVTEARTRTRIADIGMGQRGDVPPTEELIREFTGDTLKEVLSEYEFRVTDGRQEGFYDNQRGIAAD